MITTTYTNSTEARALDELAAIGVDVRVSYDTTTTRLHAKAWLFHRHRGATTAYIGSSNLTHSAQVTGLEWNVRVSGSAQPRRRVARWRRSSSRTGRATTSCRTTGRSSSSGPSWRTVARPSFELPPTELHLRPFQERLLEQIEVARRHGRHRNLLVAATGTGKTVMAAVDYARLRPTLPRARLLFVAHRQEILEQSRATFRHALRDASFGELWVGQHRPQRFEHVFASIQSLNAVGLGALDPTHFDVVIVDEFHHAAAPSYRALLEHVEPIELLGLTATPERADGLDVLRYFDGRIAAELRVWDAIDQQYLVPFTYYGIHDGLDLTPGAVAARAGLRRRRPHERVHGQRHLGRPARHPAARTCRRRDDDAGARVLRVASSTPGSWPGSSSSVASRPVRCGATPARTIGDRHSRDLADGSVAVLFTVDLFNEGIDVPNVDTLLLLRPTESATLFLQQLGRGLRRAVGKSECTVLDFVGLHRREFRFDLRYRALLGGSRHDLQQQLERNFPFLPAGCHFELDPVARDVVLASIRNAIPTRWPERVAELRSIGDVSLSTFLDAQRPRARRRLRQQPELDRTAAGRRHAHRTGRATDETATASSGRPPAARRRRRTHRPLPRLRCRRRRPLDVERTRRAGPPTAADVPRLDVHRLDQRRPRSGAGLALRAHPQVCAELAELFDRARRPGRPRPADAVDLTRTSRSICTPGTRGSRSRRRSTTGQRFGRHAGTAA